MKAVYLAGIALFLSNCTPAPVVAKGATIKITIEGPGIPKPIEITDSKITGKFFIWSGLGTSGTSVVKDEGFIIQWAKMSEAPPKELPRYQVSFYADYRPESPAYVVDYVLDVADGTGYAYLPGPREKWYGVNVGTILRGVEGHWFRTMPLWDETVIAQFEAMPPSTAGSCNARDTLAQLPPTAREYADAMEAARTLGSIGITVNCVESSKAEDLLAGSKGAAFFKTDQGDLEIFFWPASQALEKLEVAEKREGERYKYSLRPTAASEAITMDSSKPIHFVKHGNMLLYVWGNGPLAATLQQKLAQ